MTYRGHVLKGMVVFADSNVPPEGAEVEVSVRAGVPEDTDEEIPTIYERYKSFIGIIDDLPSDMARQHDHYIHGTPKR